MSYRVYLQVVNKLNVTMFSGQILGNNECFNKDEASIMGIEYEDSDYLLDDVEVDSEVFKEVFVKRVQERVKTFGHETIECVFSDSLFWKIPSWTIIGNFAIVYDKISELRTEDGYVFKLSAG